MIVKDYDQKISIIECKAHSFAQYMEEFDHEFIQQIFKRQDHTSLLLGKIKNKNGSSMNFDEDAFEEFQKTFEISMQSLVTKSGTLIFIASILMDDEQIDASQTLFNDDYMHDDNKADDEDMSTDDHSSY